MPENHCISLTKLPLSCCPAILQGNTLIVELVPRLAIRAHVGVVVAAAGVALVHLSMQQVFARQMAETGKVGLKGSWSGQLCAGSGEPTRDAYI